MVERAGEGSRGNMRGEKNVKIMSIAGARPNFMKLASIADAITLHNGEGKSEVLIDHIIVHTGQHYDKRMSTDFFDDLGIPAPDVNLEVGSSSHALQTAEIMRRFEPVLLRERPDVLLVVGDVNSTIACTLVAAKIEYTESSKRRPLIVHVEAGLRSGDRNMPEEINRVLTDALSDLLFVTEQSGVDNLAREGIPPGKVRFVGNVMIDTLVRHLRRAELSGARQRVAGDQPYALVTLHRPSNVDDKATLTGLLEVLREVSGSINVVFPVHPRTRQRLKDFGLWDQLSRENRIVLTEPMGYLDFLGLLAGSRMVITDSGGIQEETTYLRIPCLTLRENTERPVTIEVGSNHLLGVESEVILDTVKKVLSGAGKVSRVPDLWDGEAGIRIVRDILAALQ